MSEKYKPVNGDRVRVVMEGEVTAANEEYFIIEDRKPETTSRNSTYVRSDAEFLVSVEKIEPPVTVFKPGDVVRTIGGDFCDNHWVIAHGGYVNSFGVFTKSEMEFTSEVFELVAKGRNS